MKRALVTGGAGFIGSNLVKELVTQGWQVDVVDDMSNGHLHLLEPLKTRVFLSGLASIYEAQFGRSKDDVYVFECDFSHTEVLLIRIMMLYFIKRLFRRYHILLRIPLRQQTLTY